MIDIGLLGGSPKVNRSRRRRSRQGSEDSGDPNWQPRVVGAGSQSDLAPVASGEKAPSLRHPHKRVCSYARLNDLDAGNSEVSSINSSQQLCSEAMDVKTKGVATAAAAVATVTSRDWLQQQPASEGVCGARTVVVARDNAAAAGCAKGDGNIGLRHVEDVRGKPPMRSGSFECEAAADNGDILEGRPPGRSSSSGSGRQLEDRATSSVDLPKLNRAESGIQRIGQGRHSFTCAGSSAQLHSGSGGALAALAAPAVGVSCGPVTGGGAAAASSDREPLFPAPAAPPSSRPRITIGGKVRPVASEQNNQHGVLPEVQSGAERAASFPLAAAAAEKQPDGAIRAVRRDQVKVEHPADELEDTLMWLTKSGDGEEVGA